MSGERRAWLLFDGNCGFCRNWTGRVANRDKGQRLHVVTYLDAPSPPMTPELQAACMEAVHVVTSRGRVLRGGDAAIFTLGTIGGRGLARLLWRRPLRNASGGDAAIFTLGTIGGRGLARLLWRRPLRNAIGFIYGIIAARRDCDHRSI